MTIEQKRQAVADKYKTILGRNTYSQPKRAYCYKKYSDGRYYSDCSSSIALTYKECGFPFKYNGSTNPNTVGMYLSSDLVDVPVVIKKGIIQNPEILRVGDMLLYAGKDTSRKYAGYVGHVEMVYKISGSKVTICGHGSGTPSTKDLNAYCRSRYNSKTSTALGHRGLIKVRRFFVDDETTTESTPQSPENAIKTGNCLEVTGSTVNIRVGPASCYEHLESAARKGDKFEIANTSGWTPIDVDGIVRWISSKYVGANLKCTGGKVNVRCGPGKDFKSVSLASKGDKLTVVAPFGWTPIIMNKSVYWISDKYTKKQA